MWRRRKKKGRKERIKFKFDFEEPINYKFILNGFIVSKFRIN